jgi:DNA-binding IclR family transcriptional regulator
VALAFGPPHLLERVLNGQMTAHTPATLTDQAALLAEIAAIRARGWATAADRLLVGVNALAAPVFDYRQQWRGTIAIVGATQLIGAQPSSLQLAQVMGAAAAASRRLGWHAPQAATSKADAS